MSAVGTLGLVSLVPAEIPGFSGQGNWQDAEPEAHLWPAARGRARCADKVLRGAGGEAAEGGWPLDALAGQRWSTNSSSGQTTSFSCRRVSAWTSQRSVTHSSVHQAPDPLDADDEGLGACDVGRLRRVTKLETNTDDGLKVGLRRKCSDGQDSYLTPNAVLLKAVRGK